MIRESVTIAGTDEPSFNPRHCLRLLYCLAAALCARVSVDPPAGRIESEYAHHEAGELFYNEVPARASR